MKTISGKQMCKLLKSKGWEIARITGSHYIFVKQESNLRISVPVHGNQNLKTGLQKAIMKLAGINDNEL